MLIDKLKEDRIKYFRIRSKMCKEKPENKIAYSLLGVLIGDATKDSKEPTDEKVISIIKKFIDNAKICLENAKDDFTKFSAETEIKILTEYMPKQLDEVSIRALVAPFRSQNLGVVMKYFKENYTGQYDGALVSKITKEILDGK